MSYESKQENLKIIIDLVGDNHNSVAYLNSINYVVINLMNYYALHPDDMEQNLPEHLNNIKRLCEAITNFNNLFEN